MCSLVDDLLFHSSNSVEDDGARTTTNIVYCGLANGNRNENRNGPTRHNVENVRGCHVGFGGLDEDVVDGQVEGWM